MSDSEWGDLEPYFEAAIAFVEWPEAATGYLPAPRARVTLRHLGGDRRLVELESSEESLEITVSNRVRARV
jgi:tRNA A37 threonylcarbamoyladenosine biosynthesis protein TsaE